MLDDKLQRLADRADIIDCLHRYARGMDRHDRDLARSAYHEGAVDDHAAFVGDVEDFLDWSFAYQSTLFRHQHYVTNPHIELDGDVAHVESYYLHVATELEPAPTVRQFGGRYVDRFERRDGHWAIAARVCLPEWRVEQPLPARPSGDATPGIVRTNTVARDRSDTSYQRPLVVEPLVG